MPLLQVLLFMAQDAAALREEARAADDFQADRLLHREAAKKFWRDWLDESRKPR